jgi:hypothetical protein
MGETNQNPGLQLHTWDTYLLGVGPRATAEAYARRHVTTKPLLWAPLACCLTPKHLELDERGAQCCHECCSGQPSHRFRTVWETAIIDRNSTEVQADASDVPGLVADGNPDNEFGLTIRQDLEACRVEKQVEPRVNLLALDVASARPRLNEEKAVSNVCVGTEAGLSYERVDLTRSRTL